MKLLKIYLSLSLSLIGFFAFANNTSFNYNDAHKSIYINHVDGLTEVNYNGTTIDISENSKHYKIELEDHLVHLIKTVQNGEKNYELVRINSDGELQFIQFWTSLLPPIVAIICALIFKEVIFSIFIGIFLGAFTLHGFEIHLLPLSLVNVVDKFILHATADADHMAVIIFSVLIGGMVAVISRNAGMIGVVDLLSKYAKSAKSSQIITWLLGILIFFDDYANTLIVGNTMRPVTDKHKISRAKLAYIVDSTAAPIAAIAFVTTWIGAELGYIQDFIDANNVNVSAYNLFIDSLSYAYYPILTILFILFIILLNKDYGPMLKIEQEARIQEKGGYAQAVKSDDSLKALDPIEGVKPRWINAVLPIAMVVIVTIIGLLVTGHDEAIWGDPNGNFFTKLSLTIGNANSYTTLLWSSLAGCMTAIFLSIGQRIMTLEESIESLLNGIKTMIPAVAILIFAWSLAKVTGELHTAEFLTSLLGEELNPRILPVITFILAAFISFSTGSSWGTMAILYPLVLPSAWSLCMSQGLAPEEALEILSPIIAVVLGGSVLGDHCSPISDTTILSSLASHCNHIEHVKTQLPYALTVGGVSIALCALFILADIPAIILYALGAGVLYLCVKYFGKKVTEEPIQIND